MNTPNIPQCRDIAKPFSTSVRITQAQLEKLDRLKVATNSPNHGRTIETIVSAEHDAMEKGQRKPEDFIPQNERKTCTISFKVNTIYKESVAELQYFFSAPSLSAVVAHCIDWYTALLESGKAVK